MLTGRERGFSDASSRHFDQKSMFLILSGPICVGTLVSEVLDRK